MSGYIRRFERDGYVLVIDTKSKPGERLVSREYPGGAIEPVRSIPTTAAAAPAAKKKKATAAGYIPPVNRTDCVHALGYYVDDVGKAESTQQINCSCSEKNISVWECDLFGEAQGYDGVAPTARGTLVDPNIRKCADCQRYEKKSQAIERARPSAATAP